MLPPQNLILSIIPLLFLSIQLWSPLVGASPALVYDRRNPRPTSTRKPTTTPKPRKTQTIYMEDGYTGVVPQANPPADVTVTIKVERGWGEWDVNGDGKPDPVLHNREAEALAPEITANPV